MTYKHIIVCTVAQSFQPVECNKHAVKAFTFKVSSRDSEIHTNAPSQPDTLTQDASILETTTR